MDSWKQIGDDIKQELFVLVDESSGEIQIGLGHHWINLHRRDVRKFVEILQESIKESEKAKNV